MAAIDPKPSFPSTIPASPQFGVSYDLVPRMVLNADDNAVQCARLDVAARKRPSSRSVDNRDNALGAYYWI